jgi:putative membrane protein
MNAPLDSADLAPPERLHPLIILTGLGGSLRGVAGGYAGVGYLAATGQLRTALWLGAALLVGLAVSLLLYWLRFSFQVGAHEIRINSGIINRTHRSIPFDRVQDVDLEQGLLARLLGLAKVKFETGGASAGGKEEGVLPAIALHRAEALREHVRARRGLAPVAAVAEEGADAPPLFAMDLKRVLTAGVFNFSLAVFAGLAGATQTMGDLIGFDPFEREFWEGLVSDNALVAYAAAHRTAAIVGGLALLLIAGFLTGIVRTLLRDYGFRLDASGNGLRRRRGLFTRTDVTLPVRRAQAALILTGPVRDALGWSELKLQSLAQDEGGKGDHVVAPLAQAEELEPIFARLGWAPPQAPDWQPLARAYGWVISIWVLPFALLGLVASLSQPLVGVPATLLLLAVGGERWLGYRRSGWALEPGRLLLRTGWWRRRMTVLPLTSVQSVDLQENALGRHFGLAGLTIGVAGGSNLHRHALPALPRETASQLRQALLSRYL